MDVVFTVCIVTHGAEVLVYDNYERFVMQMLNVCVLCASCGSYQCCFYMTFSLVMLVDDARGNHMDEAVYSRAGPMTAVYVAMAPVYPILLR